MLAENFEWVHVQARAGIAATMGIAAANTSVDRCGAGWVNRKKAAPNGTRFPNG